MSSPFDFENPQTPDSNNPFLNPAAAKTPSIVTTTVKTSNSGAAITSLVLGLVSPLFICLFGLSVIPAVGAIISGHMALSRIKRSRGTLAGTGWAITGLAFGYAVTLASLFVIWIVVSTKVFDSDGPGRREVVQGANASAHSRFLDAESNIKSSDDQIAFGNTEEAKALAEDFSTQMQTLRDAAFTKGEKAFLSHNDNFVTHCELHKDRCVFLVQVPSYRKFEDDAKKDLAKLAWLVALKTVGGTLDEGDKLAVGMRGSFLYGAVMIGPVGDVDRTPFQGTKKDPLIPFFAPDKKVVQPPANDQSTGGQASSTTGSSKRSGSSRRRTSFQSKGSRVRAELLADVEDFVPPAKSVALSPKGDRLVIGMQDSRLLYFNGKTGREIGGLGQLKDFSSVDAVAITPNGKTVVAADAGGQIQVFLVEPNGRLNSQGVYQAHQGRVTDLCPSKDSQFLISSGADREVVYSKLDDKIVVSRFGAKTFKSPVLVARLDSSQQTAYASDGTSLSMFIIQSGRGRSTSLGRGFVHVACLSPDGRHFACINSGRVQVRNTVTGSEISDPFPAPADSTKCIALTASGNRLLVGGNSSITIWDVNQHIQLGKIYSGKQSRPVDVIELSDDGTLLAVICDGGTRVLAFRLSDLR